MMHTAEQATGQIQTLIEAVSTADPGAFTVTADKYASIWLYTPRYI